MTNTGSEQRRHEPTATYRVQLRPEFGLRQAAELVPYLARLGISHLYTSSYLQAARRSTHGYDVVDHNAVSDELGGDADLDQLHAALAANGMGHVIDVVPNHMAIDDHRNRLWWDVLQRGQDSPFARFFDIDWETTETKLAGQILAPVLSESYGDELAAGTIVLVVVDDRVEVHYHEHRFPLAPGSLCTGDVADVSDLAAINSDADALHAVLERQHYRLASWRTARDEVDYRRFFDVDTLVGLRVEDPVVFDEVHRRIIAWIADGSADGLRIDHPDGLRDPAGYFNRLRAAVGDQPWIIAEKILESGESLPVEWPIDGTTGYDFMRRLTGLFVEPNAEERFTEIYARFTDCTDSFETIVEASKELVVSEVLTADITRLTAVAAEMFEADLSMRDTGRREIRRAIESLLVAFPVYRTYVTASGPSDADRRILETAGERAKQSTDDVDARVFDLLVDALRRSPVALSDTSVSEPTAVACEFAERFQQLSGPTMAKGVEDTAFYRYHRLVAVNEVGADPAVFGVSVSEFHRANERAARDWPKSMSSSSTHDTKRSEDVRARIALLTEAPERWEAAVMRWRRLNERHWHGEPDHNIEYLLYQTLFGAHPLPHDRAAEFVTKALREAKVTTSWLAPNLDYERSVAGFVDGLYADERFQRQLAEFCVPFVVPGRMSALSQVLLKLTSPGVPDIYQGCELWTDSLVDPDNRRRVDYDKRRRMIEALSDNEPVPSLAGDEHGLAKLLTIQRALSIRTLFAGAFSGPCAAYRRIALTGERQHEAIAYLRGERVLTVAATRLMPLATAGWGTTQISLPAGRWRNVLRPGIEHHGVLELADMATASVALLVSVADR